MNLREIRTVLIFREQLLAPSETFIIEQARGLYRYRPLLAGLRRTTPSLQHAIGEVLLSDGSGHMDKLAANLFRRFAFAPGFTSVIREQNPRLVHAHFAVDAVQAVPIARKLDIPLVVSLHGFDITASDEAHSRTFSGRHYLANRELLFHAATSFLCVSEYIRQAALLGGFPEDKLHVHYTGIDCRRFRPTLFERDPKLILFVGRLVEVKGCEYALRAMELVQKKDPDARLEIIGDGPLRGHLEQLAASLGINVSFRGVQTPAEVLKSMSRARMLCNPSISEGFGMVFAEAQAVGTPVVSFATTAIPEAVKHGSTGLLCPQRDIASLAEFINLLLANDQLWQTMSERAVAWVNDNFDISRQSAKLENLYDACLAN